MAAPLASAPQRPFTPGEVLRMVETGILRPDEPVELLQGRLVIVSPQGPPHASRVSALADRLRAAFGAGHVVREEKPIELSDSLPEPDVALVRGSHADFATRHPQPHDVVLVAEVMVTSHAVDRDKVALYARDGVAVAWLLDVPARRLEVHSDRRPDGHYRSVEILGVDDEVALPGGSVRWKVRELFE